MYMYFSFIIDLLIFPFVVLFCSVIYSSFTVDLANLYNNDIYWICICIANEFLGFLFVKIMMFTGCEP